MKALMTMNLLLLLTVVAGLPLLAKAETAETLLNRAVSKLPGVGGSLEARASMTLNNSASASKSKSQLKSSDPNLLLHQGEEEEGQVAQSANKSVFSGRFGDSTAARVDQGKETRSSEFKQPTSGGNH